MVKKEKFHFALVAVLIIFLMTACGKETDLPSSAEKLQVIATTSIVGDVVQQVAANRVALSVLLPVGTDPHSFDPTPQDVARIADADIIFANGVGLEAFLENLIAAADAETKLVAVSEGIDLLKVDEHDEHHDEDQSVDAHTGFDPHVWTDPNNVKIWVQNIVQVLGEQDPGNRGIYEANAEKYLDELAVLDAWIRDQVAQIPQESRQLVTDHALFLYFAEQYGFEQVGAIIPGYSTLSEPTAQDLAAIEDAIKTLNVKAVFVGNTVNPSLAARVAADTGIQLSYVFTGSLSAVGGDAETYLEYMRYNTKVFVDALR